MVIRSCHSWRLLWSIDTKEAAKSATSLNVVFDNSAIASSMSQELILEEQDFFLKHRHGIMERLVATDDLF